MRKETFLLGVVWLGATTSALAANPIQGEVEVEAATKVDRNAGLWLDGQYVGFVKDLEGNGRLVLVPGEHQLLFKLVGFDDIATTIVVEPGDHKRYRVAMSPAANLTYPEKANTARLRVSVKPEEAAIFVNGAYAGHIDRFDGRRGMRLAPGVYRFTIALPGYESFETELTLRAGRDYEIKTELAQGSLEDQAGALTAMVPGDTRTQ
jgi:PEGA domain